MQAVLFDMDGVLVDSEDYWVELETEEILPAAVPDQHVAETEITGINYREIYDYLDEHYDVAIEREEFVAYYEDAAEDIYGDRVALLSGFEPLVDDLRTAGCAVGVVSSSPREWIGIVCDRFGIEESFDEIVSAEQIDGASKPSPGVYEHAADRIGVDPAECVAVEDSENGVEAANRAGMTSVGYRTAINREMDFSTADVIAEGPDELRSVLRARTE